MSLNVSLMTFCRSDKFKSLYKCVETFELIRSTKGHQSNIQKHDLLPKLYNQAGEKSGYRGESLATGRKVWRLATGGKVWLQELQGSILGRANRNNLESCVMELST